jgi:hypothetical protein
MKRIAGWMAVVLVGCVLGVMAADELSVSMGWTYNKGGRARTLAATTVKYDIAGAAVIENVQSVSTNASGDALVLGGVTDPGFGYFKNLDATNYIEVGSFDVNTNFVSFLELKAGEKAIVFLSVAAPRARSHTAAVRLDYVISDR